MRAKTRAKAKTKDHVLSVRVKSATIKKLFDLSEATERSRSYLASEAIEQYVTAQAWQIEHIKEGLRQARAGEFADPAEIEKILAKYRAKK